MRKSLVTLALSAGLCLSVVPGLVAQGGHFEFGGHYGRWTLNPLGHLAADLINDATSDEIQTAIEDEIQGLYPNLHVTRFTQVIDFNSRGDDFGAGVRWYPGGHRGSFSLGVSVEKSTFKVLPASAVQMDLADWSSPETATFTGDAGGSAVVKALSFQLTLRWDVFPSAAIHPYLTLGGGMSTAKALDDSTVAYQYSGQLSGTAVPPQTIEGSETKTLRQLRDEALADEATDFPIPSFIPFLQLNVGLKFRLTKSCHVLIDAGVFNGLIVNAGVAFRI